MSKRIETIDLLELARSGSFGPIKMGARLSDFANQVGPPIRWGDFSDKKRLSCLMVFGDVEVGFEGRSNDAVVTWAKFWLHSFSNSKLKFARNEDGKEIRILNPFTEKFPTFQEVEKTLRNKSINYTTKFTEQVGDDTSGVMNFGPHLKYYFSDRNGSRLTVINLS
jgi:hypothetical protein